MDTSSNSPGLLRCSVLTGLSLATPVLSQSNATPKSHVVPASYTAREAPGIVFWAVSPFARHGQLLIDQRHLAPLLKRPIKAISARRNGGDSDTLDAGRLNLDLSLSAAARSSISASTVFASNRGAAPSRVFRGTLRLPTSKAANLTPVIWSDPWMVRIPFSKPYTHNRGTLCLESTTTPWINPATKRPTSVWWPIDGVRSSSGGSTAKYGTSCIDSTRPQAAGAEAATLALGNTAVHWLRTDRQQGAALLAFGLDGMGSNGSKPIDLAGWGAPSCNLYLSPLMLFPGKSITPLAKGAGLTTHLTELPFDKQFAGATFYTQWVVADLHANNLGMTFSNGVRSTIGPYRPAYGINWISAANPSAAAGRVFGGRTPVLRFEL